MRKNKLYNCLPIALLLLSACNDETEADLSWLTSPEEKMELTASAEEIELDRDKPNDVVLTFNWTPAREMSDEYVLTYVTMLDLKINEFGSSSVKRKVLDDGVYSCSYTTEELQGFIVDDWGQSVSEVATLSFKVIAKWEGGSKFVMPESRTVEVEVLPYKPAVFDADIVRPYAVHGRNHAAQHVIQALEFAHALDGVYIAWVAHHTNYVPAALGIRAQFAQLRVRIIPAHRASVYLLFRVENRHGKVAHARLVQGEDMERQPLRSLLADAREPRELPGQPFNRFNGHGIRTGPAC